MSRLQMCGSSKTRPPELLPWCGAAGNESHAGQVFTCVAALDIAGRLDLVDRDLLCWW